MGLVLATLLLATGDSSPDVLCIRSLEVVGLEPAASAKLSDSIAATLRNQNVTEYLGAESCPTSALGVVTIQVLRAGNAFHLSLRAVDANGVTEITKVDSQRPRVSDTVNLDQELLEIVSALRAHRAASVVAAPPPVSIAAPASQSEPGLVARFGVAPLALWGTGAVSLIVAGAFQLNAYKHHGALDEGDYDAHRSAGIHSQNVARVTGVVGLAAIAVGVVLYLVRDDDGVETTGDGTGAVLVRF
ncbi:MAG: hypothetical protein ACAI38_22515 [Myxococcota bacterium]